MHSLGILSQFYSFRFAEEYSRKRCARKKNSRFKKQISQIYTDALIFSRLDFSAYSSVQQENCCFYTLRSGVVLSNPMMDVGLFIFNVIPLESNNYQFLTLVNYGQCWLWSVVYNNSRGPSFKLLSLIICDCHGQIKSNFERTIPCLFFLLDLPLKLCDRELVIGIVYFDRNIKLSYLRYAELC